MFFLCLLIVISLSIHSLIQWTFTESLLYPQGTADTKIHEVWSLPSSRSWFNTKVTYKNNYYGTDGIRAPLEINKDLWDITKELFIFLRRESILKKGSTKESVFEVRLEKWAVVHPIDFARLRRHISQTGILCKSGSLKRLYIWEQWVVSCDWLRA